MLLWFHVQENGFGIRGVGPFAPEKQLVDVSLDWGDDAVTNIRKVAEASVEQGIKVPEVVRQYLKTKGVEI